mmetsp:Transcript_29433/g.70739  ORF Transcript_29433/g.70739 Transcript_29433/m.70739 type:complete len:485 (+) Transcript_29433:219-1673(+)
MTAAPKTLEIILVNARHLPKMDTFGSCDGFCVFKFEGNTFRSTTKVKTYSPDWDETFTFQVPGDGKAVGKLDIGVFDWNRFEPEEKVGDAVIDAETMNQIVHGVLDQRVEKTLTVYSEKKQGQPVKGKDKENCEVKIILCMKAATIVQAASFARTNSFVNRKTISTPEENPYAKGSRIIDVAVLEARHLPKMDTFGSCDPFCILNFLDQEHTTPTKMNTYNAKWDESYPFYVSDVAKPLGVLKVTIMDWDRVGANDKCGDVIVPTDLMQLIAGAEVGWSGEGDFTVLGEDGKELHGNDKQVCIITLRIKVTGAAKGIDPPEPTDPAVNGPRRIQLTVKSARHLPKMDTIGTCDPFCVVEMGGQEQRTTVKKSTYAPDWDEPALFYLSDVGLDVGELRLTVFGTIPYRPTLLTYAPATACYTFTLLYFHSLFAYDIEQTGTSAWTCVGRGSSSHAWCFTSCLSIGHHGPYIQVATLHLAVCRPDM